MTRTLEAPSRTLERAGRAKLRHIPQLDGLRGAAVAAVLAFHAGHLAGGYLGVDLFFVLSGYLITSLLVLEWASSGTVSLSGFWTRRARRLLPALLAVLIAVGIASHWFVPPVSRGQLRGEGISTLGYVANWFSIFRGQGYWRQTLLPSWLEHTWSLAIEEQFYLVWPLIVTATLGLWRRSRLRSAPGKAVLHRGVLRLAVLASTGAIVSAGSMIGLAFAGVSHDRLYLGTDTRAAAILMGAALGCWQYLADARATPKARSWVVTLGGLLGAGTLSVAWTRLQGSSNVLYRGGFLVCGLAATAVLFDVTTAGRSPLKRALALRPLQWLGVISYGLYLWHWPVFQYLHPGRFGLTGWSLVTVRTTAATVVAVISYYVLELPIRRGALRGHPGRVSALTTATATVVVLLVGTMGAIDPVPGFAADEIQPRYSSGPTGAPRVVVIGDSVAFQLALEGFSPLSRELGIRVIDRGIIGCTIMRDVDDPFNAEIRNCSPEWPAFVRSDRPDIVLVLFGGWMGVLPVKVDGRNVWPCEAPWQRRWTERLTRAVSTLSRGGAKVVLVSAPTAPDPIYRGDEPDKFDARQRCSNEVIGAVGRKLPNSGFVDLARFVCPAENRCRLKLDGAVLRDDGLHFRDGGARAISRWIVPRLLSAAGTRASKPR